MNSEEINYTYNKKILIQISKEIYPMKF